MQPQFVSLFNFMNAMVPLTNEAWNDAQQRFTHRIYKKHNAFIAEGKTCRHIAYVIKGSFRYYKTIDGADTTTYFSFENNWISAYTSFLTNKPSYITIEAMEDSEVLMLSYEDMQYMYNHHPVWERFGRLMAEYLITCLDERMYSLLLKTPEERYLKALHDNSFYFDRVPQHYIASYLGVAPESLSRIRRRVMRKSIS